MRLLYSTVAVLAASSLAATAALAADELANNEPKAIDGIEAVCDGISINDRDNAQWRSYSLRLEFAGRGGQYLGDEMVRVTGNEYEVSAHCQGPWVLMDLPAGSYHVAADVSNAGHKELNVRVPASGQAVVVVSFPNAGGDITRPTEQRVASN